MAIMVGRCDTCHKPFVWIMSSPQVCQVCELEPKNELHEAIKQAVGFMSDPMNFKNITKCDE